MQKRGDFGVALLLGPSQRLDRSPVLQEQSGQLGQAVAAGVAQRRGLEFVVAGFQVGTIVYEQLGERELLCVGPGS